MSESPPGVRTLEVAHPGPSGPPSFIVDLRGTHDLFTLNFFFCRFQSLHMTMFRLLVAAPIVWPCMRGFLIVWTAELSVEDEESSSPMVQHLPYIKLKRPDKMASHIMNVS